MGRTPHHPRASREYTQTISASERDRGSMTCVHCGGPLPAASWAQYFCSEGCSRAIGGPQGLERIPPRQIFAALFPEGLDDFDQLHRLWEAK
jgi:hypothetical protein